MGLADIAEVLDGAHDRVEALRQHRDRLQGESARLDRLARTVSRTIRQLEGQDDMTAPELFGGFADRQRQFETELVEQHGEGVRTHFAAARRATEGWTREDYLEAQRGAERVDEQVLAVLRSGAAPDSPSAMATMEQHYAMVARFWTPNRESYTGLGQLYVDNPEFRQRYDEKDPRLAKYLRDATAAYARAHLT